MPPWFAERASVHFENDPHLAPAEIQTIDEWTRAGAPRGVPVSARPRTQGWNIPVPDLIFTMPQPFRVPAREELDYQFVILPLNLRTEMWVSAAEIRPGRRDVVHHAVAYIREPGSPWLRDAAPGKPFARPGVTTSDILAIYTPGHGPMICSPGMARLIPAGSDLVLQIHYTPSGKTVEDATSVGIVLAKSPPEKRVLTLQMGSTRFLIPPFEANHRVQVSGTLPAAAELLSLFPHMHLRGKAFSFERIEPGGIVDTLLHVAPYDFYWQLEYRLAEPMPLPAGTLLRFTAWYDNSPNNPRNPDPSAEITYGEQSRDEMMVGFFDVAVAPSLDKQKFFNLRQ
jgi:hypothetical protein